MFEKLLYENKTKFKMKQMNWSSSWLGVVNIPKISVLKSKCSNHFQKQADIVVENLHCQCTTHAV